MALPVSFFAKYPVTGGASGANLTLSNLSSPTAVNQTLNMGGNLISGLGAPILGTDASTKSYVDAAVSGGAGANRTLGNLLAPVAINQDVLPDLHATRSIGAPNNAFVTLVAYAISAPNGTLAMSTNARRLYDSNPTESLNFDDRTLHDSTGSAISLNWQARKLQASDSTEILNWATPGVVTFNSTRLTGVATPTLATDAATKAYVDAASVPNAAGNYLVRVATTGNITLSAPQTIDGIAVVAGNRVLVKTQNLLSENGVYVVAAGTWVRATDMTTWTQTIGYTAQVSEGTNWAGMTFHTSTTAGGTIGTTQLYWVSVGGTTGTLNNTALGYQSLLYNTTGSNNTVSGSTALRLNTTGSNNTVSGSGAMQANLTGSQNVATGAGALTANTTGSNNTATGRNALTTNTTGVNNTATGLGSLLSNTTGNYNTAHGSFTLLANSTGTQNTTSGSFSLASNTTGNQNTAAGFQALTANATGSNNTATGMNGLNANTTGAFNTATGAGSLLSNTTGNNNSASGYNTLQQMTTGNNNTASGMNALQTNQSGNQNTAIGYNSGSAITTGSNNVVIGSNDGSTIATLSNNIIISDGAGNNRISVDSTGIVNVNSNKIINLATPTLATDAATKAYVDAASPTSPTLARAQLLTSITATGGAVINFNNVLRDTQNRVTAGAAWKFTANFAGDYDVYGTMSASPDTQLNLFKNGVFIQQLAALNNTTNAAFTNSVTLAPGDYLDFRLSVTATIGANASNVVNIKLIK